VDVERSVRLPAGLRAPGDARRFISSVLSERLAREDVESAALVVSELVTNAVVHAGTGVAVEVTLSGRVLRLRVADGDTRPPVPRRAVSDELSTGRGLRLLEVLSTRWGVEPTTPPEQPGKAVWCELAVTPVPAPPVRPRGARP
jgi:anti-sigma regulatory factor (Ser/Thr protein kinase)